MHAEDVPSGAEGADVGRVVGEGEMLAGVDRLSAGG